jgi:hypothetical protein
MAIECTCTAPCKYFNFAFFLYQLVNFVIRRIIYPVPSRECRFNFGIRYQQHGSRFAKARLAICASPNLSINNQAFNIASILNRDAPRIHSENHASCSKSSTQKLPSDLPYPQVPLPPTTIVRSIQLNLLSSQQMTPVPRPPFIAKPTF